MLEAGEIDAAIVRYEEAIAADPQYALAHLNAGTAYKRAGRFNEGVRALRAAQRLERRGSLPRSDVGGGDLARGIRRVPVT